MHIRAGKLQHRIQIERNQEVLQDSGLIRKVWLPVLTTRAELRQSGLDEFLTSFGEMDRDTVVFVIRYPAVGLTTSDRIQHNGKTYNLTGMAEIGRRRGMEMRAVAA